MLGRVGALVTVNALREAGRELTTDSFLSAMESLSFDDVVTGVSVQMSPKNHRAATNMIISKVTDGVWQPVHSSNKQQLLDGDKGHRRISAGDPLLDIFPVNPCCATTLLARLR